MKLMSNLMFIGFLICTKEPHQDQYTTNTDIGGDSQVTLDSFY